MPDIDQIHNEAMDLAEEAFSAKKTGDRENATVLFLKALELEKKALTFFPPTKDSEPTRSILINSAASMAFHGRDYEQAEQIVSLGLCGYPPSEIKAELKALLDDIKIARQMAPKEKSDFKRHSEARRQFEN